LAVFGIARRGAKWNGTLMTQIFIIGYDFFVVLVCYEGAKAVSLFYHIEVVNGIANSFLSMLLDGRVTSRRAGE
jgi:hypothetical protein